MRLLVLSDIHGNLTALESVLAEVAKETAVDGLALLGDNVDYGPRSNEVVSRLASLDIPVVCSLWGNHEKAIIDGDYSRFSSQRGVDCAAHTSEILSDDSIAWINEIPGKQGQSVFSFCGRRFLAIHGVLGDPFWGTLAPRTVNASDYTEFDVVLSGHSHLPHSFGVFVEVDDPILRNKRMVEFINPGSVGQPRNRDPRANFAIWDSDSGVFLSAVSYDVKIEQGYFDDSVDSFYSTRLEFGV